MAVWLCGGFVGDFSFFLQKLKMLAEKNLAAFDMVKFEAHVLLFLVILILIELNVESGCGAIDRVGGRKSKSKQGGVVDVDDDDDDDEMLSSVCACSWRVRFLIYSYRV